MAQRKSKEKGTWSKALIAAGVYLLVVILTELLAHWILAWEQAEYIEWFLFLGTAILLAVLVQRRIAATQRRKRRHREVLKELSTGGGADFFPRLTESLARVLEAQCAFVCELKGDAGERIHSLAVFCRGRRLGDFEASSIGTPVETVLREGHTTVFSDGMHQVLIDAQFPSDLAAESFLGTPLIDANGQVIGLLAVLDDRSLAGREGEEEILPLFAARAAGELERLRAETAVRQSRDRLQAIITNAFDAVVEMDGRGVITSWNPRAEEIFGWSQREAVGRKPSETIIPRRCRDAHEEGLRHFLATGEGPILNRPIEMTALHRDGREIPIELTLTPTPWEGGFTFCAFIRDISERQRVEEALRESEERFRATFNQAAVGIGHVDPAGRWLRVNQKYCDIVGYTVEELTAMDVRDITHPDDLAATMTALEGLLEGTLANYSMEKRYIRKDGSTAWVNLTVSKVSDADGKPRFFVGVAEEITARKEVEQALRFSQARYQALYRDNPTMIATLDAEWTMLSVNPACAGQLGYTIDELEGESVLKLFHGDDRPAVAGQLQNCLENPGRVFRWQFRKIRKDGELLWVDELAQTVQDPRGDLNVMVVCQDITERRRAQEEIERLNADLKQRAAELEDANRELEAFNFAVAHDLRKPLTTIIGYCQILRDLCADRLDEACNTYLRETYEGTWRMNRLIDTLLDFSRVTRLEPHRKGIDLSALARRVAVELKAAESQRQVRFQIAEGIRATGDESLMQLVLENLFGNAWKYTGEQIEGFIEFGEIKGEVPVYFVRDNGSGFSMADADRLFIPFQRLPGSNEVEGHGVGLATVERIIRRHGGRIWAEAEPGRGATFFFTLAAG
jgi:PAS domain S-box-containing protein